ncbi:MAG: hypothetical protein P1U74_02400 [Legionellaceae bacterium]|nr:hypothetical protein [Legionellaceae bacterium]
MRKYLFVLISFLMLSSCKNIGPLEIPVDRRNYNESLQHSEMQQHLLNIVRLRYSDPPYFLAVNSIVAQFTVSASATANVTNQAPPPLLVGFGELSSTFSDSPTITFSPIQGGEFLTRLMSPIDISVVYMLLRSGWGINHIIRPITQRFNNIENASIASRVTSSRIPIYKEFMDIGYTLLKLQHTNQYLMRMSKLHNKFAIHFIILSFEGLNKHDMANLKKIGVDKNRKDFWLTDTSPERPNEIYIETRTVLGLLNYFSKGVHVPEIDVKNKQALITYYPNGDRFYWDEVTKGLFEVHSSQYKPNNAFVSIWYRNKWFYISDSDFDSKETMNLIMIIMGIYQGKVEPFLPVFTVS